MKKIMKILSITMILCMALTTLCFASNPVQDAGVDLTKGGDLGEATGLANRVLSNLQTIGIFVAVGMAIFLGIKYVAASPEGKSELKKQLGVYVLGIVLILGASMIVGAIGSMVNSAS